MLKKKCRTCGFINPPTRFLCLRCDSTELEMIEGVSQRVDRWLTRGAWLLIGSSIAWFTVRSIIP